VLMIDPICRRYGIRMIVVDRPGIGATPVVPLEKRIEISCRTSCVALPSITQRGLAERDLRDR
jgi:hypothetical protein